MLTDDQWYSLRRVIAVANAKGGVGKTSITTNVGALLADEGFKVLIIDWDPQNNTRHDLGYATDNGLAAFQAVSTGQPLPVIANVRERLDVVASGDFTKSLKAVLRDLGNRGPAGRMEQLEALAVALLPIAPRYDFILIDCPPEAELLQEIALGTARWLLAPVKLDSASLDALADVAGVFVRVREEINPGLDLLGVVLFDSDTSASSLRESASTKIRRDFGYSSTSGDGDALDLDDPLFQGFVRHAPKPSSLAREQGVLVFELEDAGVQVQSGEPTESDEEQAAASVTSRLARSRGVRVTKSMSGLAADYQRVALQSIDRIQAAESAEEMEEVAR
ncbi:ParA family protein [Promicromonospora sp. NFX87]|uniref:ParA family protein n=1 Tax=Promicromonospora sp. NFX87 TaxID=3402691 RepID=UPI003AFAAB89